MTYALHLDPISQGFQNLPGTTTSTPEPMLPIINAIDNIPL